MYQFKFKDTISKCLLIEGSSIDANILKGIYIKIQFNEKGFLYASLDWHDKERLKEVEYEHFILEAQLKAYRAIKNRDFSLFINSENLIDIIDSNYQSYYKKYNKNIYSKNTTIPKKESRNSQYLTTLRFNCPSFSLKSLDILKLHFDYYNYLIN